MKNSIPQFLFCFKSWQTKIADRTVRRILKKFVDNKTIESVGNAENTPNKKYKLAELKITYIYNGGYSNNPEFVM